jgi:hypothetical protein
MTLSSNECDGGNFRICNATNELRNGKKRKSGDALLDCHFLVKLRLRMLGKTPSGDSTGN